MTYELVDNFAAGLDNRKSPLTAPAGTLTRLTNAVITPGGEISKRRAFNQVATVTGTFGLAATAATLYVFGRNVVVTPAFSTPVPGVTFVGQKLPNSSANLVQTDFDVFDGKIYWAGHDPGVNYPHYYNAVLTEGTGKGMHVRTYQSKVYAVLGGNLYFCAVNNPLIWNAPTSFPEIPILNLSNTKPTRVVVDAAYMPNFKETMMVSIKGAVGTGMVNANGTWQIMDVGVPANTFTLADSDTSGGAAPQTSGASVTPSPSAGRGFINLSMQDAQAEQLISLEVYYDKLAIFSSQATQVWAVDPDPLQNAFVQLMRGAGTIAPLSPLQYGNGDVLYLDSSGIRSLKARDSSNSASVSDIGSPVDPLIQDMYRTRGAGYMSLAIGLLEPSIGRFWMIFPDQVFVLSYFPGPKITAWSRFTLPFTVQHAVTCGGRIFIRDTVNRIWVYGSPDPATYPALEYDACGVDIRLPYLNGKKPGHNKVFEALDATMTGAWTIKVSYDFNNPDNEELVGNYAPVAAGGPTSTWRDGRGELSGYTSHISLRFYNTDVNIATLSNIAVHYKALDDEQ